MNKKAKGVNVLHIEIKQLEPELFAVIEHKPESGAEAGVEFASGTDEILDAVKDILENHSPTPPPAELSDKS